MYNILSISDTMTEVGGSSVARPNEINSSVQGDQSKTDTLAMRIKKEMSTKHSDALEKNFDIAKKYVAVTLTGNVDVLVKDKIGVIEAITLYLLGKHFAVRGGFSKSPFVGNLELLSQLGLKKGSLLPGLKKLRDDGVIETGKSENNSHGHAIKINRIEASLKEIDEKLDKKS